MIRIAPLLFLIIGIGCAPKTEQTDKAQNAIKSQVKQTNDKIEQAFDLKLNIEKSENSTYQLVAKLDLKKGSYVVSPYSKDSIYGHVNITLDEAEAVSLKQNIVESPQSVEEYDENIKDQVRFVKENTTFTQALIVTNNNHFETSGKIEFVLEPQCIPYYTSFTLTNEDGDLKLKDIYTSIDHNLYKL